MRCETPRTVDLTCFRWATCATHAANVRARRPFATRARTLRFRCSALATASIHALKAIVSSRLRKRLTALRIFASYDDAARKRSCRAQGGGGGGQGGRGHVDESVKRTLARTCCIGRGPAGAAWRLVRARASA